MALQFCEEEFEAARGELDLGEPQSKDGEWELFVETMGVKIYRRYDEGTGLYEYKVYGTMSGCPADVCANVYMDLTYRKNWDSYVKELYEKDFEGQGAIYWEVKYPFPLSNRDYVYVRKRKDLEVDGRKIYVVLARSAPDTPCEVKKGVIRVCDYKQSLAIESDGATGTKMFMHYFDNPGGNIPTWLINWAAKSGVPDFLTKMKKACTEYPSYCQKK